MWALAVSGLLAPAEDWRDQVVEYVQLYTKDTFAFPDPDPMHDDVLELKRRDPLASGLDDVLDAIGDPEIAVGRDHPDVIGVQITARP